MVTVETGARLHFGFQNLSLAHDRLYGGVGVALDGPCITLAVEPADGIHCESPEVRPYLTAAVEALDVSGVAVDVVDRYDRHVGFGSGTQLALACLVGIANAYGLDVEVRKLAPRLGRGGRSGVGVATFEAGGFVVDAGHRSERFTSRLPEPGEWTVPKPLLQHSLPENWRFVLLTPTDSQGRAGANEQETMQSVVERADPTVADEIAAILTRRLLPAVVEADLERFARAIERIGRLNGTWYADEQGGLFRPPAGTLIEALRGSSAIYGTGQSSWGPTVYGVTNAENAETARDAAETALERAAIEGTVRVVAPRNTGASVDVE